MKKLLSITLMLIMCFTLSAGVYSRLGMSATYTNASEAFGLGFYIADALTFPIDETNLSVGMGTHFEFDIGLNDATPVSFSALVGVALQYDIGQRMAFNMTLGPAFGIYGSGIRNKAELLVGGGADLYYTLFFDKNKTVGLDLGVTGLIGASLGDKARNQSFLYQVSGTAAIKVRSDDFWFLFPWYWWMFFTLLDN